MKPFAFKLQTALDIKMKEEAMQKEELFKATQIYRQNVEFLKSLELRLVEVYDIVRGNLTRTVDVVEMQNCNDYLPVLKRRIEQQITSTENARQEMEQVRYKLIEMMRDRKVLEKLKGKQYQEYIKECLREEQNRIDEMATIGFIRRDSAV